MLRLLREHKKKSTSRSSSRQPKPRRSRSPSTEDRKAAKSVRFTNKSKAYIIESETEGDDISYANNLTTFNENNNDELAHVAIKLMGLVTNVAHLFTLTNSLDIDEISFMVL